MLYLNQTYELLNGGYYSGNSTWNKKHSDIDNCFKLYQLTKGEVFISTQTETFKLQENRLYFINGNKLDRQYCNYSFSTHWLHFIPKDLLVHQGLLSLPAVVELPTGLINLPDIMSSLHPLLYSATSSSWEYTLNILQIQILIQTSILELFHNNPIDSQFLSCDVERIKPAIQYINQYYKESIKLEQLATLCCMSPNYFHKMFKNTLNTTPANYQTLLRMNAALQLLANKEMSIKNIAYELGYTDDAHFCRSFKKYYSITPSEYQKKGNSILL